VNGAAPGQTGAVNLVSSLDAPCAPATLFAVVEDLGEYPHWLSIVPRAVADEAVAPEPGAAPIPAWVVDLRGRLGPLARSKRLRMVRTVHDPDRRARFERREVDGRSHSAWVLEAEVAPVDGGSRLTMSLHYGGSFGGSVLERMLRDEIERSRPRLLDLLASASA
jgi:hypothetical protein